MRATSRVLIAGLLWSLSFSSASHAEESQRVSSTEESEAPALEREHPHLVFAHYESLATHSRRVRMAGAGATVAVGGGLLTAGLISNNDNSRLVWSLTGGAVMAIGGMSFVLPSLPERTVAGLAPSSPYTVEDAARLERLWQKQARQAGVMRRVGGGMLALSGLLFGTMGTALALNPSVDESGQEMDNGSAVLLVGVSGLLLGTGVAVFFTPTPLESRLELYQATRERGSSAQWHPGQLQMGLALLPQVGGSALGVSGRF